jgi:ABC-type branched-subunit amino acid transport system ATPase component
VQLGTALVPEGRGIFGNLSVRENLRLGGLDPARQPASGRPRPRARALPAPALRENERVEAAYLGA